jgi:hexokinase
LNISLKAEEMLRSAGMHPDDTDIGRMRETFVAEMKSGLGGRPSSLHMLPTYLTAEGQPSDGDTAIAVDIGGTNLRVALTEMKDGQLTVVESAVSPVPGLKEEISKDEFFHDIADKLLPQIGRSQRVGVCFSHAAEILPNRDGRLVSFSKEIKVKDAAGMEICRGLSAKLMELGVQEEKRFVLLNDTAAVLFGGMGMNSHKCADIGLVLGTGMNIGYVEKTEQIGKLRGGYNSDAMLVNIEAGCFDKLPFGEFDRALDAQTDNPGDHLLEKMTGGVYLGVLIGAALRRAGDTGLLSAGCAEAVSQLGTVLLADASAFLAGQDNPLLKLCITADDRDVVYTVIDRLVARAAKLIASAIAAVMDQTGAGIHLDTPAVIAAEGSTFYKLYSFKDRFLSYLTGCHPNRYFQIASADNATLIGTGYAALLNC